MRGTRVGPVGFKVSAVPSAGVDWALLDACWAAAGEEEAFDAGWSSDHLTDAAQERGGGAFEAFTTLAALAHRVPGRWLGVAVAANTFRHPAMLAKQATILDNATGGRFVLGIGAGWHEGEHEAFGIPLPPMRERFDRYESALRVLEALFSAAARQAPGVTLDDPFFPLRDATNEPGAVRPEGPAIWLGGQGPRGIALAARFAEGWPLPGNRPGDVAYFREKRDEIRRALEAAGRDPDRFTFAGQVVSGATGVDRRAAADAAVALVRAGAGHIIVGVPGAGGPDAVRAVAREVAPRIHEAAAA